MRALDRFFRRDEGRDGHLKGARLGSDILDLSPFGGRWEAALAEVLGSERVVAEMVKTMSQRAHQLDGDSELMRRLAVAWRTEPRLMIAVGAAMDPALRSPFGRGWGYNCNWSAAGVIAAAWLRPDCTGREHPGSAHGILSVADMDRLAPVLGWPSDALISCVVAASTWGPAFAQLEGAERYVVENAAVIGAALAPPARQAAVPLWRLLDAIGPGAVAPFANELAHAAAATSKAVRKEATAILAKLPSEVIEAELKAVAEAGGASQTSHALDALARLADPDRLPELARWAGEAMAASRSASVAEAVERLESAVARTDYDRPELPPTRLADLEPLTTIPKPPRDVDTGPLLRTLNGEISAASHHVIGPLAGILSTNPQVANRFTTEHVARALLTLYYHAHPPYLTSLWTAGDPSPLMITAVAEHDGHESARVVHVVGVTLEADPTHWTDEQLGDWIRFHVDDIVEALDREEPGDARAGLFTALARATNRPDHLDDLLAARAVGGRKADREQLLTVLGPESADRIIPFLAGRKRTERQHAAAWIRHHGVASAATPLLAAARKESDDAVKGHDVGGLGTARRTDR